MALGLNFESASGDFLAVCKYDAKAGRMFRRDRENGETKETDITKSFAAIFDLENIEVGWISFPVGLAPEFIMVPLGDSLPARPSDQHKQGARLMIRLSSNCGGDARELASTAKAFLRGLDDLHNAYLNGEKNNPGLLPIVRLADTMPITTGEGARKSTNYQPVFEIVKWQPRPEGFVFKPRAKTNVSANGAAKPTPASTGSERVGPPAARAEPAEPARPTAEPMLEEEFG